LDAAAGKEHIISRKVFVGNLNFDLSREDILELFGSVGPVTDVVMPIDKVSGRPRGFAFVEFELEEDAAKAMETLNGKELAGRQLKIDEARERPPRMPRDMGGPPPFDPGGRPFKRKGSRRGIRGRKRGF
jgi:RNA recognition motif-containing protein